jgi:phosphotransacetylase
VNIGRREGLAEIGAGGNFAGTQIEPQVAFACFSTSARRLTAVDKVRRPWFLKERRPDNAVDGEMQFDPVVPELIETRYPFAP